MVQALYWSLGAGLMEEGREKFDAFVKEYAALPIKSVDDDKLAGAGEIPGVEATVFEYFWDNDKVGWVPWVQLIPEYVHHPELPFNKILVPTVDTVRTTWILDILVKRQCPVCILYRRKSANFVDFFYEISVLNPRLFFSELYQLH